MASSRFWVVGAAVIALSLSGGGVAVAAPPEDQGSTEDRVSQSQSGGEGQGTDSQQSGDLGDAPLGELGDGEGGAGEVRLSVLRLV